MTPDPKKALVVSGFLVVRADGELRVVKNHPRLRMDEVAFPVKVHIPITWGRVQVASIDVTMPEPPEAIVTVDLPVEPSAPEVET